MHSALWKNSLDDLIPRVEGCLNQTLSGRPAGAVQVYFRADDIAVPSAALKRLLNLFQSHGTALALAVVPAWLTPPRWTTLSQWGGQTPELWCWHQHGWRHFNHAPPGSSVKKVKKAEFGDHRSQDHLEADLKKGFHRLESILGHRFEPIFTPPWNRVGNRALRALESLGFSAISRDEAQCRSLPAPIPELPVHVDLHTHKAADPIPARQHFLETLTTALTHGSCGIMIHHQRMNDRAFAFLDYLLDTLERRKAIRTVGFTDIMG